MPGLSSDNEEAGATDTSPPSSDFDRPTLSRYMPFKIPSSRSSPSQGHKRSRSTSLMDFEPPTNMLFNRGHTFNEDSANLAIIRSLQQVVVSKNKNDASK
jgi:hypothetical protein